MARKTPSRGIAYQEFDSLEDYREFFRKCQDAGANSIPMMVPDLGKNRNALTNVLVTDPGHDHNLVKALLDQFKDVKWKIAPVRLTEQRRLNTDKLNYRVRLRKHLVTDYRRDMKGGAFFPLLVFVSDREYWASGRHRSEAAESQHGAVMALVVEKLTPSQILFISDTTNRWHSEKWDGDEMANLAYSYHMIDGMTINNALLHVGLEPNRDKDLFQAVQLWRRYPDINQNGSMGHPMYFPELCKRIFPYLGHFKSGTDETGQLTRKQWNDIIWDNTGTTKKVKAPGDRQLSAYVLENGTRGTYVWAMKGDTVKDKYKYFLELREKKLALDAATRAGVKEIADDEKWVSFVRYWKHFDNAALVNIQQQLDEEWQEESRKLVYRLNLIFGD